ncbi:hypothetical protein H0H81_011956 [Sphagnurus paluster]|uniref:Dienelactone hydrolase domain-containing protein n=1 Tax=Sphagnurus paluster TaxID=117069 RepID=A0A9P7FQ42_9AGAR|nr:hypothetical protein H0H81_011956 [Sphagnurus paluster]
MSCPDCTAGEFLPGEPTGTLSTLGAYLAASPSSSQSGHSKRAIVLLTDVFGLPLKNCKIVADHIAKELSCDVWVPDYFAGWPIMKLSQLKAVGRTGGKLTWWQWFGFVADFITAIREERKYEKVGAVGYCYGGAAAIRLGTTNLVESIVVCHPGDFTINQAKAIKVPSSWVCAEEDQFFSKTARLRVEAVFADRKEADNFVDYEFKDYKGTVHGFGIRPNLTDPAVKEAYEKSLEQITSWFAKTLQ